MLTYADVCGRMQDLSTLSEAIAAGMHGRLSRMPRESMLGKCFQSLAGTLRPHTLVAEGRIH